MPFEVSIETSYPTGSQMNVTILIRFAGDFQARREFDRVAREVDSLARVKIRDWYRTYDTVSVFLKIQADRCGSDSEGQLLWNAVGKGCDVFPFSNVLWNDKPLW